MNGRSRRPFFRVDPAVLLILCLAGIAACSEGIVGTEKEITIRDSYIAMAIHYNSGSVEGVRAFYSFDYKHDGLVRADLDSVWSHRLAGGSVRILGLDVSIGYSDSLAECVLDVRYDNAGDVDTIHIEPGGEYGDVCFWKKERELWKLIGNRQDAAP